jgi:hypothetical protein
MSLTTRSADTFECFAFICVPYSHYDEPKTLSYFMRPICLLNADGEQNADALAVRTGSELNWSIPLPDRKPFREAKLRIDSEKTGSLPDSKLVQLIVDALEARQLVINHHGLSINQIANKEGRCRKQMTKLVSVSWLSPRIVESIVAGTQPKEINRTLLLETALPTDWGEQENLLGLKV